MCFSIPREVPSTSEELLQTIVFFILVSCISTHAVNKINSYYISNVTLAKPILLEQGRVSFDRLDYGNKDGTERSISL